MANLKAREQVERRVWVAPKVLKMEAGAAEAGSGILADGGGPGASRS